METNTEKWKDPTIQHWVQLLLQSYQYWTGKELLDHQGSLETDCRKLFEAPFVVVSHGNQSDPILNYGNRLALQLWEMDWDQLTRTPSRLTAEPLAQSERTRMLAQATTRGFITDYKGIRISRTGRRFLVKHALVWNVIDQEMTPLGQAATFSAWISLEGSSSSRR